MINLIEGRIDLDTKNISVESDYAHLNALNKKGLVEKRTDPGGGEPYFYAEVVAEGKKFGVIISLQEKKIEWLLLRWLDGPCTSKGWDDVSEEALKKEYRLLLNFVEKMVGRPPDNKRDRQRTWRFAWGQVDVSYDSRDFVTQIYMKPE